MEILIPEEKYRSCGKCNNQILLNAKFCSKCGARQHNNLAVDLEFNKKLTLVFAYYFSSLAFIVLLRITEFQTGTVSALISDIIFALITLGFVYNNWTEIRPLFSFKNVHVKIILLMIAAEVVFALGVNSIANYINRTLFDVSDLRYYYLYEDSISPFFFTLISIAVFPAIFEELGFRGVVFNHLSKVTTRNSVIIVSSALFAVIHLSVIALIWILPLGLLFAYFRNKYNTLWYGIIGHFVYNGLLVLIEFVTDGKLF